MDPQFDKAPTFNMPQQNADSISYGLTPGQEQRPFIENGGQSGEMMPLAQQTAVLPVVPMQPMPLMNPSTAAATPTTQLSAATPTAAQNDDLDEEWIGKAKAIVDQTRLDPYMQSQELSKIKANYLMARHGREVKTAEDHAR